MGCAGDCADLGWKNDGDERVPLDVVGEPERCQATMLQGGELAGAGNYYLLNVPIEMRRGHALIQTTERYLGSQYDLVQAVNDRLKIRMIE
jgi:hypothetical protein